MDRRIRLDPSWPDERGELVLDATPGQGDGIEFLSLLTRERYHKAGLVVGEPEYYVESSESEDAARMGALDWFLLIVGDQRL